MVNDITSQLSQRVHEGLSGRLAESNAMSRMWRSYNKNSSDSVENKKHRLVILDLNSPVDVELWGVIYNTPERFTVVEKKISHQKEEYMMLLQFLEHGDDLSVTKTKEEFLKEYVYKK